MSPNGYETRTVEARRALDEMRGKFVSNMEMRIVELEKVMRYCKAAGTTEKECREIRDISHKLAGLAPSLGFSNIGKSATFVEKLADSARQGPLHITAEDLLFIHLEDLLEVMEASLD